MNLARFFATQLQISFLTHNMFTTCSQDFTRLHSCSANSKQRAEICDDLGLLHLLRELLIAFLRHLCTFLKIQWPTAQNKEQNKVKVGASSNIQTQNLQNLKTKQNYMSQPLKKALTTFGALATFLQKGI